LLLVSFSMLPAQENEPWFDLYNYDTNGRGVIQT